MILLSRRERGRTTDGDFHKAVWQPTGSCIPLFRLPYPAKKPQPPYSLLFLHPGRRPGADGDARSLLLSGSNYLLPQRTLFHRKGTEAVRRQSGVWMRFDRGSARATECRSINPQPRPSSGGNPLSAGPTASKFPWSAIRCWRSTRPRTCRCSWLRRTQRRKSSAGSRSDSSPTS